MVFKVSIIIVLNQSEFRHKLKLIQPKNHQRTLCIQRAAAAYQLPVCNHCSSMGMRFQPQKGSPSLKRCYLVNNLEIYPLDLLDIVVPSFVHQKE